MAGENRKGKKMIYLDCVNRTNSDGRIIKRDSQVERNLEKLVGVLVNIVPQLTEVRVFGSYNNGTWDCEKSDIDVLVEMADEHYSRYKDRREGNFQGESLESVQRIELKEGIGKKIKNSPYEKRFSIHLLSMEDVKKLSAHYEGNFVLDAKSGRPLYSNKQNQTIN